MTRAFGWLGALALTIVAFFVVGGAGAHLVSPASTYTIAFTEIGLPSGASWSVYFNGVTTTATTSTISFTGISAGGYYYSAASTVAGSTGVQYAAPAYAGYEYPPYELSQYIVYQKQDLITFAVSPSGGGSTSPSGLVYYNTGSNVPVSAIAAQGYTFSSWTSSAKTDYLGSKTVASTNLTVNAPATLTAKFKATSYKITYTEVGLPASTTWSVVSGGATYSSSTSTISAGTAIAGSLSYTISPVSTGTNTQYSPQTTGGSMSVPNQVSQFFSFVEQFAVTIQSSPSGTGTTYPSGTAYYNAGSNVSVYSYGSSTTTFSSWTVSNKVNLGVGSKTAPSTNLTVRGPGTLTGNYATATPCTTCTATINEVGLPSGTTWSLTVNSQVYLATISPTTTSMSFKGLSAGYFSFNTPSYVSATGSSTNQIVYLASTTGTYIYIPYSLGYTILYTKAYSLNVVPSPYYYGGSVIPSGSGYYAAGATIPISAVGSTYYSFSKWTSNTTKSTLGSATAAATTVTLNAPTTITGNFVTPYTTVNFTELGLPGGTTWGVTFNGIFYGSSTPYLLIHSVAYGSYSWSAATPIAGSSTGTEWSALGYSASGSLSVPYQVHQELVWAEQYSVVMAISGGTGGSTTPSTGTTWYTAGTMFAVSAENATAATFKSWKASSTTSIVIASTSSAATYVTIQGTGTLTCNFV